MMLLDRMARDLRSQGRLSAETARVMWAAYAGYGALLAVTLVSRRSQPPSRRTTTAGVLLLAAGALLDAASIRAFSGPDQLTGTRAGNLVTGGAYRYSRNPQYTGMVAAVMGLSVLRRSWPAIGLSAALGALLRRWVPVEERHLARQFGEPYDRYRASTPRWLGLPKPSRAEV